MHEQLSYFWTISVQTLDVQTTVTQTIFSEQFTHIQLIRKTR